MLEKRFCTTEGGTLWVSMQLADFLLPLSIIHDLFVPHDGQTNYALLEQTYQTAWHARVHSPCMTRWPKHHSDIWLAIKRLHVPCLRSYDTQATQDVRVPIHHTPLLFPLFQSRMVARPLMQLRSQPHHHLSITGPIRRDCLVMRLAVRSKHANS